MKHLNYISSIFFQFLIVLIHFTEFSQQTDSSMKDVNAFFRSIDRIAHHSNERYHLIGDEIAQIAVNLNKSDSRCYRVIEKAFKVGLSEEWSAKFINSNSFSHSNFLINLLAEQYTSLGDFDSCLSVSEDFGSPSYGRKYCLLALSSPQLGYYSSEIENIKLRNISNNYYHKSSRNWLTVRNRFPVLAGLCVPAVCKEKELKILVEKYFEKYLQGMQINVDYCQRSDIKHSEDSRFGYILAKYSICIILILSLYCTFIYPIGSDHSKGAHPILHHICTSFHIGRNILRLFCVKVTEKQPYSDIDFVHGIKSHLVVQMLFIHTFFNFSVVFIMKISYFAKFPSFYNSVFDANSAYDFAMQIDVVPIWISAFFIMSGFLSAYVILSQCKQAPPFLPYLLYRYLNLLPLVLATLGLTMVFQHLGSGPLFHPTLTDTYVKPCYDYWWTHVLLINNFWNIDQMCGPNLWFISANFQLYLLLFPILYLYYHRKRFAYFAIAAFGCFNIVYVLAMVYFKFSGLPNSFYPRRFRFPVPYDAMRLMYTSPATHMFAYFLGVLTAIYLVDNSKTIKKITLTFYHSSTVLTFTSIFLLTYLPITPFFKTEGNEVKSFAYALSMTVILVIFVIISTAWLLLTVHVRSSYVKQYLQHRAFVVISRLTYGLYFLNAIPIWFNASLARQTPTLSWIYLLNTSFMNVFQTFLLAILMYIFIEAPFRRINLLLFNK